MYDTGWQNVIRPKQNTAKCAQWKLKLDLVTNLLNSKSNSSKNGLKSQVQTRVLQVWTSPYPEAYTIVQEVNKNLFGIISHRVRRLAEVLDGVGGDILNIVVYARHLSTLLSSREGTFPTSSCRHSMGLYLAHYRKNSYGVFTSFLNIIRFCNRVFYLLIHKRTAKFTCTAEKLYIIWTFLELQIQWDDSRYVVRHSWTAAEPWGLRTTSLASGLIGLASGRHCSYRRHAACCVTMTRAIQTSSTKTSARSTPSAFSSTTVIWTRPSWKLGWVTRAVHCGGCSYWYSVQIQCTYDERLFVRHCGIFW